MDSTLLTILIGVAAVILGTFVLRKAVSLAVKVGGLMVVALIARRQDIGARGWDWMTADDFVIVLGAALFGWLVSAVLSALVFREDGLGRHFGGPLFAVAAAYGAAMLIEL
jgi:hypothetical protein